MEKVWKEVAVAAIIFSQGIPPKVISGWWADKRMPRISPLWLQTESTCVTPVPVIWYHRQIKVFSWIASFQHQWLGFHCCSKSNHSQSWNPDSHRCRLDLTHCFGFLSTCLCIYCLSSSSELFSISSLKWLIKICVSHLEGMEPKRNTFILPLKTSTDTRNY